MAKDFTKQARTSIFEAVAPQATPQEDAAQAALEAQEAFHTQGKKGMKMMRLSVAFTPSNEDYIRTMSRIEGMSMIRYINKIIERDRQEHGDLYEKAKALLKDQ